MTYLHELASLIRSKNAGPFEVTFDVMFDTDEVFDHVVSSRVLTAEGIAAIFGVAEHHVHLVEYPPGRAVKFTLPREVAAGDLGDRDVVGCQLYAPLVDLEVPAMPPRT